MHRIEKTDGFWSVRANRELRIIPTRMATPPCSLMSATHDAAYLVRSPAQLARARAAIEAAGERADGEGGVALKTMHDAKGLEFRAVAVMACDEDVLPDPERSPASATWPTWRPRSRPSATCFTSHARRRAII
jgi:hypothetical protein